MVLITVRVAWHDVAEVGDDLAVAAEDGDKVLEENAIIEAPTDASSDVAENKPCVDAIQGDGKSEEIVLQESNGSGDERAEGSLDMRGPVAANDNTETASASP
jgi:hypothetical protein